MFVARASSQSSNLFVQFTPLRVSSKSIPVNTKTNPLAVCTIPQEKFNASSLPARLARGQAHREF